MGVREPAIDIFNLPTEATVAVGDYIAIWDASAGQVRKMTQANFTAGVGVTDHGALTGLDDDDHGAVYPGIAQTETITGQWDWEQGANSAVAYSFENTTNDDAASAEVRAVGQVGYAMMRFYAGNHTSFADSAHFGANGANGGMTLGKASPDIANLKLDDAGNVVVGATQLADNATDGFLYIPGTTSGAPSGTPTAYSGRHAMVFDDTNNKLYVYGGSWIDIGAGYAPGGTDVALADGGTGASLADPGADRIMFWDESANAVTWLTPGSGLTITDTTMTASGTPYTPVTVDINATNATYADPDSSGTWTMAMIECWGGGGAGGKGRAASAGSGGGGGGYNRRIMKRSDITFPVNVTIGAGGPAQTTADTNGADGGTTTFGTYLAAYGGGGGRGVETTGLNSGGSGGSDTRTGSQLNSPNGFSPCSGSVAAAFTPVSLGCGGGATNAAGGAGGPGDGCFGAGGGGGTTVATAAPGVGGNATWGGAGGGAGAEDNSPGPAAGGTSVFGGNGGMGGYDANAAVGGTQPAGGGGGSETGDSGAGGAGRVRFTRW